MAEYTKNDRLDIVVFETSENGNQLTEIRTFPETEHVVEISLNPTERHQEITGIGGSFTEASAYLLNRVGIQNREKILEAYFGESGARYSFTRTHMNSCDFSLSNYSYAPEERKHLHPAYVPVFRYARDFIGTLNNEVDGWIDWNMVLDRRGGPNWAENCCIAPVIVDTELDEIYLTPLCYTMSHFTGTVRIGHQRSEEELQLTVVQNPDDSIVVVLLTQDENSEGVDLEFNSKTASFQIKDKAIQTVVITARESTFLNHK